MDAAIELFHRVPFVEVSMVLSKVSLGKKVDIMDDHEGSDEESTPTLRRSARTRPMFRAQRGPRSATPQRQKVLRDLLKHHARSYYELSQLVMALEALWNWRVVEDQHVMCVSKTSWLAHCAAHDADRFLRAVDSDARQRSRVCLDDLISAMEPLMHGILQHAGPGMQRLLIPC